MKAFALPAGILAATLMIAAALPLSAQVVDPEQRIADLEEEVAALRADVVTLGSQVDMRMVDIEVNIGPILAAIDYNAAYILANAEAIADTTFTGDPNIILNAPGGTVLFATKAGAFSIDGLAASIVTQMNVMADQINNHSELHEIMVPDVIKLCLQHPTVCE